MWMNEHFNTVLDIRKGRQLRHAASPPERKIWVALNQGGKQRGLRFRRQHPIHPYIVDFACLQAGLLIELDGASHDCQQSYDHMRDQKLASMGYSIMRFTNEEAIHNTDGVVTAILDRADALIYHRANYSRWRLPHPNPPHKGEGITSALLHGFANSSNTMNIQSNPSGNINKIRPLPNPDPCDLNRSTALRIQKP